MPSPPTNTRQPRSSDQWLTTFSSVSPSDGENQENETDSTAKERRREQVRRAQRTHRDRKATYVKALELEVAKLRAKDAHTSEDLRRAQVLIQRLQNLLTQYGIPVGSDVFELDQTMAMATIELVGRPPFGQTLHAQLPIFDHSAPAPHVNTSAAAQTVSSTGGPDVLLAPVQPEHDMTLATASSPRPPASPHPAGLDTAQVGINFVLALEHACLYHHSIPSVPMLAHGYLGTGHSLMISSPIMDRSPQYSLNPLKMGWPRGSKWEVPAVELEKLLNFSDQIDLEAEVTPVQAWHKVKSHANFDKMTAEKLEALRDSLAPKVKCVGFGAVIEQRFFEKQLESVMGSL